MKANKLVKSYMRIEDIYTLINQENEVGSYKCFIPHWRKVGDDTKLKLMEDGFKVYIGAWDGIMVNALIIEW